MLDPAHEFLPPPTSPSISSVSSSDLDTESTGSFFHDRSTTLGTLMGVTTCPPITFRAPSQRRDTTGIPAVGLRKAKKKNNKAAAAAEQLLRGRRRWWWRLCSDEELKPSKLGEFLEVERRFGDGAVFEVDGVENIDLGNNNNGRLLFADGRVLPPAAEDEDSCTPAANVSSGLCRFSVSLPGICSGGVG